LRRIFNRVVPLFDCSIICGFRSEQAQNAAFLKNRSKVKWPNSNHNKVPSMALDAAPYDRTLSAVNWADTARFYYMAGIVKAVASQLLAEGKISHDLRWGGDWNGNISHANSQDQDFMDLAHFELIKLEN
jgi:peptidoglycan L-alanyl-D-glutamate endopeptidase CwlK